MLFTMFIGLLVALVNMNYARVRAAAHLGSKHSILEYVTGKYLAIQLCRVVWEWEEPQVVGKTMTFKVKVSIVFFLKTHCFENTETPFIS